jgi:Arm DNA-binding domain
VLLVTPNGCKLWRFRYRAGGLEKMLGFGSYPDTSAKQAREKVQAARKLLACGVDPSDQRQAEKVSRSNTFESVAREWLELQQDKLVKRTYDKAVWTLDSLVIPFRSSATGRWMRSKRRTC